MIFSILSPIKTFFDETFMTLNDKSSPEDIKATFGISKGQFKKALGGLMKAGKIKQDQFGTELI